MEAFIGRVGIPMFVQLSIETWNELILIILIFSMIIGLKLDKTNTYTKDLAIPMSKEIVFFYSAILMYNFFDIAAHLTLNDPSEISSFISKISVFLYFLVGECQTLLYLYVIWKYVIGKDSGKPLKYLLFAFFMIQGVNFALLIVNPFTNVLYLLNEGNEYVRCFGCYIWQGLTIFSFVFVSVVIILRWKKTDKFVRRILVVVTIFPVLGLTGSLFILDISLNNIMVIISALLMFMIYEKNKAEIAVKNAYDLENARVQLMEKQLVIEQNKQELQESKIKLLVAKIQPHFIFNSLMALQSKSMNDPELYEGIKSFGKYLRASFEAMTDNILIPFEDELKNIRAYIQLERINYGDKLRVEYDIEIDSFMLPALCVEPLVENAVRYGVGTYEKGGLVKLSVREESEYIIIEVWDDGSGGNKLTDAQKGRKSIGLENVRLRLKAMDMGELSIRQDENGTSAIIRLNYEEEPIEDGDD